MEEEHAKNVHSEYCLVFGLNLEREVFETLTYNVNLTGNIVGNTELIHPGS